MSDQTVRGRFVWYDLLTPDPRAAQTFYSQTLGWKVETWGADSSYKLLVAPGGPLAGLGPTSGGAHWLGYVWVDDIRDTLGRARSLGATVAVDATDIQSGGQYAVLTDPQGAAFGVYSSTGEPGAHREPRLGEFLWHELATTNYEQAFEFYSELFDWEPLDAHEMGDPVGTYLSFGRGGTPMGGMFTRARTMPGAPAWLFYVRVKDVHGTVRKAAAAGAEVLFQPLEVPGGDVIAQFVDPQGAAFAAITLAADAAAKSKSKAARQTSADAVSVRPARSAQHTSRRAATKTPKKSPGNRSSRSGKKAGRTAATHSVPARSRNSARKTARASAGRTAKKIVKKSAKKARKAK